MLMFECSRATAFKAYLEAINTVKEEITFHLDHEGLKIEEMDPSHVSLVCFKLPYTYFDTWNVSEPETITVNLDTLLKSIKKVDKDEHLRFEYEGDKLTLTLISDIQRKKVIQCLELIEEELPTPRIFFKSKVRMVFNTFKRILEDFMTNQNHLTIETSCFGNTVDYSNTVSFSNEGDEYNESVILDNDNDNILEIRVEKDSRAVYDIGNFIDFVKKAVKLSEVITLNYSEDMPFMLDIEIPMGTLYLYCAPCIGC